LRRFGAHNFVEVAALASGRFLLVQESQVALIEFFKPLVPVNVLQALFTAVTGKVQPEQPDIALVPGALYAGGMRSALLCPAPDLFVILRRL
jgi:hypothetical protein